MSLMAEVYPSDGSTSDQIAKATEIIDKYDREVNAETVMLKIYMTYSRGVGPVGPWELRGGGGALAGTI